MTHPGSFKDSPAARATVGVDASALAGIDVGKGKKRASDVFDADSDNGNIGTSKKQRLVPYELDSDADIEMADD